MFKQNTIPFQGIGGYFQKSVQEDMVWNRVANLKRRPAGSVGLDLVNEFLNKDFKG